MIVRNIEDAIVLLEWIQRTPIIAYDIETDGLNPRKNSIYGFGISDHETSFYVPNLEWKNDSSITVLPRPIIDSILLGLKGKKLITHNAAFDLPFTKNFFGIDLLPELYLDTMLLKHTVDEEFPFGLKQIAARVFGASETEEQEAMKASAKTNGGSPTDYYKADLEILAKYCQQDCKLTYRVMQHYLPQLKAQGLEKFFFEDEVMPLYREVTIPMEQNGIKLNIPKIQKASLDITADINEIEDAIQKAISPHLASFIDWYLNKEFPPSRTGSFAQGIARFYNLNLPVTRNGNYSMTAAAIEGLDDDLGKAILQKKAYIPPNDIMQIQMELWEINRDSKYMFNLSSKHHLKKLFFEILKETPVSTTELGNPQVDDEFLQLMAQKYDWVQQLIVYNRLTKIKGTYITRFLDEVEDGRFYPSFQQHRTISGRYAGDLQQLPRPLEPQEAPEIIRKYNNQIREFFIADDGYTFVDDDYESAEPRTFAHISGDPAIKAIFLNGHDFYSTIAILVEGLEGVSADKKAPNYLGKVNKPARQRAKAYALGIPYGMSGYKLSFELGISIEEADALVEKYLAAFPALRAWMEKTAMQVKLDGQVRAETGRIRHMPRAAQLYKTHGEGLLNSLEVWKKYHNDPKQYAHAKELRKEMRNYIANGNNFQIQSRVASTINLACLMMVREFRAKKLDAKLVAQMHDEVIVHCHSSIKTEVGEIVQRCMETASPISVPMIATPSYGSNFREAKG